MSGRRVPVPEGAVRLALVRHGEASGNAELRYLGDADVALTERGREQAAQIAQALGLFRLDAIYSSPLVRAADTAAAIAAATGLAMTVEPALRESSYGAWEQLTRREVLAGYGALLQRWETDPDAAPPGGESLRATQRRVVACVDLLATCHPGGALVLVSHVGPVKLLVCHVLGLGPQGARRMWLDPATLTIVDWPVQTDGPALLRLYNAAAHPDLAVRWLAPSDGAPAAG